MKQTRYTLSLALIAMLLVVGIGCAKKSNTNPPSQALPTNAINQVDADMNSTLQPIHAFVASIVAQNNAGTLTLTVSQKAQLNTLVNAVNLADSTYQTWHAAGAPASGQAQVQTAITNAQTAQTALNATIQGGK